MTASGPAKRLQARGLALPPVPAPAAAYRPAVRVGSLVFTAGQLPTVDGVLTATGLLGRDLTTDEGAAAAEVAALNLLAVAADACGGLERFRLASLTVYVASTPDFVEHHLVANGASMLLAEVLGSAGEHARAAVGVGALPLGSPVEVSAVISLESGEE